MSSLFQRRRIEVAGVLSLVFNCLLFVASFLTDPRGGNASTISRVIEILGLPAGAVAELLAGGAHGGTAQVIVMIGSSVLLYMGIAWIALRLFVRSPGRVQRSDG